LSNKQKRKKSKPRNRNFGRHSEKRFADGMRAAGRLACQILDEVEKVIEPGITTVEIDGLVDHLTQEAGAESAPLNYGTPPFPGHCCISVNAVVCHGIPSLRVLLEGDIVNVDVTPKLEGYHGDTSRTFAVGEISDEARRLIVVTEEAMWRGIEACSVNAPITVVGDAIQPFVEEHGFSVVEQYTGHGTGKIFHKDPPIPHMRVKAIGGCKFPTLQLNTAFTIEPMVNTGDKFVVVDEKDAWTVTTKDGSLSAQFEHTLLVTREGIEVVTEKKSK
jgi:methionyl aminopeptidase